MFTVERSPRHTSIPLPARPAPARRAIGAGRLWDDPIWAASPSTAGDVRVSHPGDALEVEATAAANRVAGTSGSPPKTSIPSSDEGQPLPPPLRSYFEPRMQQDFASVLLHTGPRAAEAAEALHAQAFTVGEHVVMGSGVGGRVLAHELAHVVQHRGQSDEVVHRTTGVETEHAGRSLWARDASGNELPPTLDDVKQGHVGDCYLFAALAAIVTTHAQRIVDMIIDNGSSYTVTFSGIGWFRTARQTVTPEFAKQRHGEIGGRGAFWPLIIEKAYAQEKGGIDKIEGGDPGDAIDDMTNVGSSHFDPGDEPAYYTLAKLAYAKFKQWAATIFTPPLADAAPAQKATAAAQGIKWNHAYAVIDVDQRGKLVRLFNPWGEQHPNGTGWVNIESTRKVFDQVDIND